MKFDELKIILKRLFNEYVKTFKENLIALVLSIIVAGSTSGIAWLLDPAKKYLLIDRTFAWVILILIIIAFTSRFIFVPSQNKYNQSWRGSCWPKRKTNNILLSDIQTLENRHSEYISNIMFDAHQVQNLVSTGV